AICRSQFRGPCDRARSGHRRDHQRVDRTWHRPEAAGVGRIQSKLLRAPARPVSAGKGRAGRRVSAARYALERAERARNGGRLGSAAGHQTDADAAPAHSRCLRDAGPGCTVRAVHLFGGAADPEIAARRFHRSVRADLDESSARARLGVSQALDRPAHGTRDVAPNAFSPMAALKILIIPGSLRTGSHNARLAAQAAYEFTQGGVDVTPLSLSDFPL